MCVGVFILNFQYKIPRVSFSLSIEWHFSLNRKNSIYLFFLIDFCVVCGCLLFFEFVRNFLWLRAQIDFDLFYYIFFQIIYLFLRLICCVC